MLLTHRFVAEYARRPINLVLLIVVPVVFVALAGGALTDFAEIVGGFEDAQQLAAPTAAWAAAFLAGVAGFFHVLGSRDADRRLAAAGMGAGRIVASRLASGLLLAGASAGAALAALAVRTGVGDPFRAIAGTVMAAVIYLAVGAAVGAVVRTDVNGSLVVIFIWMIDVFFGPAMANTSIWITRIFPTHFVTLVALDSASGHAGPIGDLGWALVWTVGALVAAAITFWAATAGPGSQGRNHPSTSGRLRLAAGLRYGFRDYRRNVAMWVLLVTLPILFITLSFYITPDMPTPVELTDSGMAVIRLIPMIDLHGAIMVPITVGFLAGLAGLFVVQGSVEADSRLALAGFRSWEILVSRLGVIVSAAILTTGVALAVTAFDFTPMSWTRFALANVIVATTYAMIGVLAGSVVGRLGGLYLMFLIPFVDIGIAQNAMFSVAPPSWGVLLPGHAGTQILLDAAFTPTFDELGNLILAGGWLIVIGAMTATVFRRIAQPRRA